MCLKNLINRTFSIRQPDTLEELRDILRRKSRDMTDAEMCELWYKIDQIAFHELGEVYAEVFNLGAGQVVELVKARYPTIEEFRLPDTGYAFTSEEQMARIIRRDYTYRVKYVSEVFDCDDFADLLKAHLSLYYRLSSFTLWGEAGGSSHAYVLTVLKGADGSFRPRLIEPQSGIIFSDIGPCGRYVPRILVHSYGKLKEEAVNGKPG